MNLRHLKESDYNPIIAVLDDWWGGRPMTHLLLRVFHTRMGFKSRVLQEQPRAQARQVRTGRA